MTSKRYPAPQDPAWMLRGICADDPDLMSPREDDPDGVARARRVCGNCPVALDCLNAAMAAEAGAEPHLRDGVRGGFTPTERYTAYRHRRPPKKKELQPCGTKAAYRRHQDHGEKPCAECHQAMLDEAQVRRDAKRAKKKAAA